METARAYVSELVRRLSEPGLVDQLAPAVEAVVASVRAGGLTYIFGTGHSHLLALELHYRAGGPAFVVPILDESMMLHEGAIASTARERESGAAAAAFARYTIATARRGHRHLELRRERGAGGGRADRPRLGRRP